MFIPQQTQDRPNGRGAEWAGTLSTAPALPMAGGVDDSDSPVDMIDLLALEPFVTGRQPYARTTNLENVRTGAPAMPAAARLVREAVDDRTHSLLGEGDDWTIRIIRWKHGRSAMVSVTATTPGCAESVLARAVDGAVDRSTPAEHDVPIGFWRQAGPRGAQRVERDIDAAPWSQIRKNYTAPVASALDELMTVTAQTVSGKILLLHGPPGTGKTTLLRALAQEWRNWCQVDCVLDPERLFADPGYLMEVALGDHRDEDAPRWRLLLLEDCDELIRGDARASAGQSLSRLLNLSDGLLGQGRNVLTAITTNENLSALHPAVTRPGRCLARIEVGPLTFAEATAWLGSSTGVPGTGATLAELYALQAGIALTPDLAPTDGGGLYL